MKALGIQPALRESAESSQAAARRRNRAADIRKYNGTIGQICLTPVQRIVSSAMGSLLTKRKAMEMGSDDERSVQLARHPCLAQPCFSSGEISV